MCVNNLPRVALDSGEARIRTHDLLIASPAPYDTEPYNSLSVLTVIFQVNLGKPVFTGAKDDGSGGDNWSYNSCKAPVKSSPPTNQHPVFTGRMPFLSPNQ